MPSAPHVIALLVADIHLCHRPPVARSAEPDWYAAMKRPLDVLKALMEEYSQPGGGNDCKLIIAGDVFDKWEVPCELLNWTLSHLPYCYAIPGQHDLPNHQYSEIHRSAYWNLVKAGRVTDLDPAQDWVMRTVARVGLQLHPFPWGHGKFGQRGNLPGGIDLAVIHSYIWTKGYCYEGAPEVARVKAWRERLQGYTAAVFGDNHKGFLIEGAQPILNCGSLMRRTIDQISYQPTIGRLWSDGTIDQYELDCSQDKFIDPDTALELIDRGLEIDAMLVELRGLGTSVVDFIDAVKRFLEGSKDVGGPVKQFIYKLLSKGDG